MLEDHANPATVEPQFLRIVSKSFIFEYYFPGRGISKAIDAPHQCRFSGAASAEHDDEFTFPHGKIDAFKSRVRSEFLSKPSDLE